MTIYFAEEIAFESRRDFDVIKLPEIIFTDNKLRSHAHFRKMLTV